MTTRRRSDAASQPTAQPPYQPEPQDVLQQFTVRLAVPVEARDAEEAVTLLMRDISHWGLKQYVWSVGDDASDHHVFVGQHGLLDADTVHQMAMAAIDEGDDEHVPVASGARGGSTF